MRKTRTQKIRHMLGNIIQETIITNRNSPITSRENINIEAKVEEDIIETSSIERRIITKAKAMCKKIPLNIKQNSSHTQTSKKMTKNRGQSLQNLLMMMALQFKNLE